MSALMDSLKNARDQQFRLERQIFMYKQILENPDKHIFDYPSEELRNAAIHQMRDQLEHDEMELILAKGVVNYFESLPAFLDEIKQD